MSSQNQFSAYDNIRKKNFVEKLKMMKMLGLSVPTGEPIRSDVPPPVPAKRGRPPKKPSSKTLASERQSDYSYDDSDESGDDDEDDDWKNKPVKKKRKRGKKAPLPKLKNSCLAIKTVSIKEGSREARYPKRDTSRPSYKDSYIPGSDDMLYCADCKCEWEGDCPEHGPLLVIEDKPIPANIYDKSRAKKTAPWIITVADSKIPEAGRGVWARDFIPARVRFGPYAGKVVSHDVRNAYSWLVRKNGRPHFCIDATEPGLSNWMRFVNCARYDGEQNLEAFQYCGDIYYRTLRRIAPHEELLVWYGDDYGRQLGIDPKICDAEDEAKWKEMRFKCHGCNFSYMSPMYLDRHKKVCRQLKIEQKPAQTYQCSGCQFLFSDAEYLQRHMRLCRKLSRYVTLGETRLSKKDSEESTGKLATEKTETFVSDKFKPESKNEVVEEEAVNCDKQNERRPSSNLSIKETSFSDAFKPESKNEVVDEEAVYCDKRNERRPSSTPSLKKTCISDKFKPESRNEVVEEEVVNSDERNERRPSTSLSVELIAEFSPTAKRTNEWVENKSVMHLDSARIVSDAATEDSPKVSTKSAIDQRVEAEKMKRSYVRLERIPWFSDVLYVNAPFRCIDCHERFCGEHSLASHALEHRKQTLFICATYACNKTFCHRERLLQHVETHAKGKESTTKGQTQQTILIAPTDLKYVVCPKCYKFFSKREDLMNHVCVDAMSEKSLTKSNISTLRKIEEEKCFTCSECKQASDSSHHLRLHHLAHREGKRFVDARSAERFVNEHQDLKPCQSSFKSDKVPRSNKKKLEGTGSYTPLTISGSLKNYLRTPREAFVCSQCNMNFSHKNSLIVHCRTHRRKKPFICYICKQGFLNSGSFQQHVLIHKTEIERERGANDIFLRK